MEPDPVPDRAEKRYRNVTLVIIMLGVIMASIDTTAVVLALPTMMTDLNSDIISMPPLGDLVNGISIATHQDRFAFTDSVNPGKIPGDLAQHSDLRSIRC